MFSFLPCFYYIYIVLVQALSLHLSVFLPSTEKSTFELMLRPFNAPEVSRFLPRLKKCSNSLLLVCVLRFRCHLSSIVQFLLQWHLTISFFDSLSYPAKKERPLGNVTRLDIALIFTILCLYIYCTRFRLLLPSHSFFTITTPT